MSGDLGASDGGADGHLRRQIKPSFITQLGGGNARVVDDVPGFLAGCLERATAALAKRLGGEPSKWRWGDLHHTEHRHPLSAAFPEAASLLDPPKVQAHGDSDTPLSGATALHSSFTVQAGSINRYIHDPSNWSNSRWVVPLGASGHPGSPHYSDQQRLWADVQYIPQLWDWPQIEREAETTQKLVPPAGPR
jgi:penicillin amidase